MSSVDTGRYSSGIELNAVQRANAEMQKRAYNVVRALCEEDTNPVVSIHDHGSAGHVNCLSELVEECGGLIDMSKLPIGDKTLSAKEIIANESQERMGLLIQEEAIEGVVEEQSENLRVTEEKKKFIADFYKYSFVGVMLDWIKRGIKEATEEIANMVCVTMHGNVGNSLRNMEKEGNKD